MSATPAYPLPGPATNEDTRFCLGLALDAAAVLTRHGYPPLTAGADLFRRQQALRHAAIELGLTLPISRTQEAAATVVVLPACCSA